MLVLVGVYALVRGPSVAGLSMTLAGLVLVAAGTFAPSTLRMPSQVWWTFAHALGWVNARVLLTAFFFFILTPAGALLRLLGRDPLRATSHSETTWSAYPNRINEGRHYERQF